MGGTEACAARHLCPHQPPNQVPRGWFDSSNYSLLFEPYFGKSINAFRNLIKYNVRQNLKINLNENGSLFVEFCHVNKLIKTQNSFTNLFYI